MNPWHDTYDLEGRLCSSIHRDGHKVGLFDDGWWVYPAGWTVRGTILPIGPRETVEDAKRSAECQGFQMVLPETRTQGARP